ncbi:MAG: NADH-quinone oxidoreductase subunit H [Bacteroidetes bacterium]|nr:MAG: NADH-quinone oxidoreductase subunit H [Bacteroidota bacterium]TAG85802.1 MAG: NADH-quinone oxidoreductase subunit H [Bacteroidota bacterium]
MITLLFFLLFIPLFALIGVYAERKVSAYIQDRVGPTEVGKFGFLQTIADIIKLLTKEDIIPTKADKNLFKLAPLIIFVSIFAGFAVIPLTPTWVGSGASVGVFYLLAIISLDVIGILMAGWASKSKFPLLGAMRAVSQILAYEIPTGMAVLTVVMICQSLDLQNISYQQGIWINYYVNLENTQNYLFGLRALDIDITYVGGFLTWNIFRMPLLFISFLIFFVSSLAECNRAPFDIPEAESELIGGYHTEYSGLRWAFMMLAEYAMMLLVSLLAVILFFGGWNTPFPNVGFLELANWTSGKPDTIFGTFTAFFWLFIKTFFLVFIQMWARWTYPRLRVDQLMYLCWKVLIPFSLLMIVLCGIWRILM